NPILTNPNLESVQASARLEAQQLSWPPWQQQTRPFAGDTTTAGADSAAQPADTWAQPDDRPKQGRYATGLIVIATAAVAASVSYLWSSHQGSNSRAPADLVSSAAPSLPPDPARQPGARAVAEAPSPPPESARRLALSPSEEARLRERAQQLTIKAARL